MNRIAAASNQERADLFRSAALAKGSRFALEIMEKDFWVCWTLFRLFSQMRFRPHMIFKGGTSLSKAYGAIHRFSEDVDLSFSRIDLGMGEGSDPEATGISGSTRKKRLEALTSESERVVKEKLVPELRKDFGTVLGAKGWKVEVDPN